MTQIPNQETFPGLEPPQEATPASAVLQHAGEAVRDNPYADNERRAAERAQMAAERGSQTGTEQTGFYPQYVESATAAVEPPKPTHRQDRRPISARAGMPRGEAGQQDQAADRLANGQTGPFRLSPEEIAANEARFAEVTKTLAKAATIPQSEAQKRAYRERKDALFSQPPHKV